MKSMTYRLYRSKIPWKTRPAQHPWDCSGEYRQNAPEKSLPCLADWRNDPCFGQGYCKGYLCKKNDAHPFLTEKKCQRMGHPTRDQRFRQSVGVDITKECNPSVMGSSNTNVPLYPSLKKRGKGRFHQHNFKIPLYPPLPKGDRNTRNWGVTKESIIE